MWCNKIKTELSEQHIGQEHEQVQVQESRKEEESTYIDNKQSMSASQLTRITFSYSSHPHPAPLSAITVGTVIYPQQEIIYYPVIHNKLVLSPSPNKSQHQTAISTARKRTPSAQSSTPARKIDSPSSNQVLTPQQFRKLSLLIKK